MFIFLTDRLCRLTRQRQHIYIVQHSCTYKLVGVGAQVLLSRINAAQRTASGLLTVSPARAVPGAADPLNPGGAFRDAPARSAFSPVSTGASLSGSGGSLGGSGALPPRGGQKALGGAARLAVVAMAAAGGSSGGGGSAERDMLGEVRDQGFPDFPNS